MFQTCTLPWATHEAFAKMALHARCACTLDDTVVAQAHCKAPLNIFPTLQRPYCLLAGIQPCTELCTQKACKYVAQPAGSYFASKPNAHRQWLPRESCMLFLSLSLRSCVSCSTDITTTQQTLQRTLQMSYMGCPYSATTFGMHGQGCHYRKCGMNHNDNQIVKCSCIKGFDDSSG